MFVIRVADRGSVIWYGPMDVTVLPNALADSARLEADVVAVLRRPSSPLRRGVTGVRAIVRPLQPGTPEHAMEALLSLPGAELMHADMPSAPSTVPPSGARRRTPGREPVGSAGAMR